MKRISLLFGTGLLSLGIFIAPVSGQTELVPTIGLGGFDAAHNPLQVNYTIKPAAGGNVALTFQFVQKAGYTINLSPEPKLDIVKGEASVLPAQLVPTNKAKVRSSPYYGEMAPLTVTVARRPGLQARMTYFFCFKKDGFCARKIEKVDLKFQ
jgi:hypothetical protein